MGKSPLETEHCMPTESPELEASSPKENGFIWGGTKKGNLSESKKKENLNKKKNCIQQNISIFRKLLIKKNPKLCIKYFQILLNM